MFGNPCHPKLGILSTKIYNGRVAHYHYSHERERRTYAISGPHGFKRNEKRVVVGPTSKQHTLSFRVGPLSLQLAGLILWFQVGPIPALRHHHVPSRTPGLKGIIML